MSIALAEVDSCRSSAAVIVGARRRRRTVNTRQVSAMIHSHHTGVYKIGRAAARVDNSRRDHVGTKTLVSSTARGAESITRVPSGAREPSQGE